MSFSRALPRIGTLRTIGDHRVQCMIAVCAVGTLLACSDEPPGPHPRSAPSDAAQSLSGMSSCGASFRMISTDDDSLMAPYDIMRTVDTVDVCENWTGSDYAYEARMVGSSDNVEIVERWSEDLRQAG